MSKRPSRNHEPAFKAKLALESMQGDQTIVELAERYRVHPNQIQPEEAVFGTCDRSIKQRLAI